MPEDDKTRAIRPGQDLLAGDLDQARLHEDCLMVMRGSQQSTKYDLTQPVTAIGRDAKADIVIADEGMSRRHAEIVKEEGRVLVRDNQSTNGTFVNGQRITEPLVLQREDLIRVGNTILKFLPKGDVAIVYLDEMETAATTDLLTQLFNQGYIMNALDLEFNRCKGRGLEFSILLLDIDHFKKVNDTYGHHAGDHVLRQISRVMEQQFILSYPDILLNLRDGRVLLGRCGGAEFLALCPELSVAAAQELAENIRVAVEQDTFICEDQRIPITMSIGVAGASKVENTRSLFVLADKALYEAKTMGRNRVDVAE